MDHRKLQVKITKAYQNSYQIHSQGKTWQPTLFRLQTLQKKKIIKNKIGVSSPGSSLLLQKVAPASK